MTTSPTALAVPVLLSRICSKIPLTQKHRCFILAELMQWRMRRLLWGHGIQTLVCAVLVVPSVALADTYTFTALPNDVAGPAGSTVGWGYAIANESTVDWLVLTGLSAGIFEHGSPNSLFDFPILAPGSTVTVGFDAISSTGLYELIWDATAPAGFVNSGVFDLSGEWWDGDPLAGGNFLSAALDESAPYSATVSGAPATVPEPSAIFLLLSMTVALSRFGRQRGRRIRVY
ncbi:MAG: hypothetical protein LAP40_23760 [Acidobacteriia bacterium]|nr:hypothetical protein [Terriglobia bacterium]